MSRSLAVNSSNFYCWFVFSALLVAMAPAASFAQFPNLPPETVGNNKYEWKPELGGYRDKATKLVWGYSASDTLNYGFDHTFATNYAKSNYGPSFVAASENMLVTAARYEEVAATEPNPARAEMLRREAQRLRDEAPFIHAAGVANSAHSNWRLPTLAEFQDARRKGLFTRGTGGFNMDKSPIPGLQSGYGGPCWTSELAKNKKKSTMFNIDAGTHSQSRVTSSIGLLLVRNAP